MRNAWVAAVLVALLPACSDDLCAPGEAEPCTCASGASGLAACDAAGNGFGACDCGAAACAPGASHVCEGSALHAIDACGNRDPMPARLCACACAEGGTACPEWDEPPALQIPADCSDRTACLRVDHVHCELVGADGLWKHGLLVSNACDEPIRCYLYHHGSVVYPITGGWRGTTLAGCMAPPLFPAFEPGQSIFGWQGYDREETCRERWDSPRATEFGYHACVRADDPLETCLPGLTDAQGRNDCSPLEPVCR